MPLTQDDVDALNDVVGQPTVRGFLAERHLMPAEGEVSESLVLHALLEVGLRTVRDARNAAGYAMLAADPEYQKQVHNLRSRRAVQRRPRHADDE